MKVMVISEKSEVELTLAINEFIEDVQVLDIKFSTCPAAGETIFSALIMYAD